jgi:hypothetical protein
MASNLRALVSNIDGNWGHWDYSQASATVDGVLTTANVLSGNTNIYFPPGATNTAPTESQMFFSTDFAGWTSKSNWMIQLQATPDTTGFNSQTVNIYVGRPSGVEELIISRAGADLTWGGGSSIDLGAGTPAEVYENIVGPVTYFRFESSNANLTSVRCFVIAWNEGDICGAVGRLA